MLEVSPEDRAWIDHAIAAAADNVVAGGGPFGALIVRGDDVVARGVNQVTLTLDPTAHAEVVAIRAACTKLGDFKLTGCVLVTSCEPCPLCLSAAMWARLDRVIYAADRHDAAAAGFDDRAFSEVFSRPREDWPVPVVQVMHDDRTAPFEAWERHEARVDY